MDTPRRWQVGSLATAVSGLSLGAMLLGRPDSVPVEPIALETEARSDHLDGSDTRLRQPLRPSDPEIVGAEVVSVATPLSLASTGSPDEQDDAGEQDGGSSGTGSTGSGATTSGSTDPAPAPADSFDSPDDVDSVESNDSD